MEGNKWTERKHGVWRVRGGLCYGGYGNDGRRGYGEGRRRRHGVKVEEMESRWRRCHDVKDEKEK